MNKVWRVAPGSDKDIQTIEELETVLMHQRGIRKKDYDRFFNPSYSTAVHNPHEMYDMGRAVDRIFLAIKKKERILIYGDYDADGVSATAIAVSVLSSMGAQVIPYIPHRMDDGYGLSKKVLCKMRNDIDVVITVDCGISNIDEIAWLSKHHKDVIVVDHHEIPDHIPHAYAILHPRHPNGSYPWPSLSGAGVAWKLAQALLRDDRSCTDDPDQEKWLLDLALLGTVGDVMPLLGENRAITKFGLEVLRRTRRPGLKKLMELARLSQVAVTAEDISYRLIPLLNAAGRVDHAQPALDVLLARNNSDAGRYGRRLQELNTQRQLLTKRVLGEAEMDISTSLPFVFAANERWPAGIVGLVAGRLAEKMSKPAIVIGGNGKHAVGSARGCNGVHMLDALRSTEHHLIKVGGHAEAVGFSLLYKNVQNVRNVLAEYFTQLGQTDESGEYMQADAIVDKTLIQWNTVEALHKFEPFGEGNEKPTFVIKDLPILETRIVGKQSDHVKFRFVVEEEEIGGIGFGLANNLDRALGRHADVVANVELDEFNGASRLQLNVKDVAPAGTVKIEPSNTTSLKLAS